MQSRRRFAISVLAVLVGVPIGISAYTFQYAQGLSYLSNDAKACANCHIMSDEYEGWQKGPHHAVATCNDCHTPHDLVGKYTAKAVNGYHHSKAFTLQNFHEPIQITPRNAAILQDACLHCHSDFVSNLSIGVDVHARSGNDPRGSISCVHCHRGVGHGH